MITLMPDLFVRTNLVSLAIHIPQITNRPAAYGIGIWLIFWGVFGLSYIRKRPGGIQGLTAKQFKWCCIIIIFGGAMTVIAKLFDELLFA